MRPSYTGRWALLIGLAAAGCAGDTKGPNLPAPLETAAWHVHTAESQPMPALVAHSLVQNRLQQTFLDSARLNVTAAGRWELRVFLQTWRDGTHLLDWTQQDAGAWAAADTGYVFTSELRGPRFVLQPSPADSITLRLQLDEVPGYTFVTLRRSEPRPPLPGVWRASHVRDAQLPSAMHVIDPAELPDGRRVSVHAVIDSIFFRIDTPGTYEQRVYVSEWWGAPGGPPQTLNLRSMEYDRGDWQRHGDSIRFESGWMQNHRMQGSLGADGVLRMSHGLGHGSPPVDVRYQRD